MTNFKRAEPKPVPENWREDYHVLRRQAQAYFREIEARTGEYPYVVSDFTRPQITIKVEDIFSLFETMLITPAYMEAWRMCGEIEDRHDRAPYVTLMSHFRRWWVYVYLDYDPFDSRHVMLIIGYLTVYFYPKSLDEAAIQESYTKVIDRLKERQTFYDEKKNGAIQYDFGDTYATH